MLESLIKFNAYNNNFNGLEKMSDNFPSSRSMHMRLIPDNQKDRFYL